MKALSLKSIRGQIQARLKRLGVKGYPPPALALLVENVAQRLQAADAAAARHERECRAAFERKAAKRKAKIDARRAALTAQLVSELDGKRLGEAVTASILGVEKAPPTGDESCS